MTTHTAAASGMATWLFCDYFRTKKLPASGACIGAVVGYVGGLHACMTSSSSDSKPKRPSTLIGPH